MPDVEATVAILTYNGARYAREILEAVQRQRLDGDRAFEVLVIDSGSTDGTLEIVRSFPTVILHQIPNVEFGHGRTRNLAAELANGTYVAFLTHDATPAHDRWLHELLAPFSIDPRVAAVMGKQVPRPHCFPLLKYEIRQVFHGFGPDFGTTIFYADDFVRDQATADALAFYSDVNSATRRDLLTGELPYRDVDYAEDQLFGRDVLECGLHKAYAPRAAVVHSNDLTLRQYRRRIFDETVGLRQIGFAPQAPDARTTARLVRAGVARDTIGILRDPEYSLRRKLYWCVVNPAFHVTKWRAVRHAVAVDLGDAATVERHSLERARRG